MDVIKRNTSVYCSRSGLSSVPRGTPKTTRFLHLSRNNFQTIGPHTFPPLPVLEYLDLSWNNLYSIQNHTFYNINHLKILYLNNTLLQTIQNGAFADLQNLEVLGLAGTRVSDLSNPDFLTANLKNLRSLSFANSSIKGDEFTGLGNLKTLNMSGNELPTIVNGSFSTLGGQSYQCYKIHGINSFPKDYFKGLVNLKKLDLQHNNLRMMLYSEETSNPFENLTSLKTLNLRHNEFHNMSPAPFKNLSHLESLDLSQNRLSVIPIAVYKQWRNLRKLFLQLNLLQMVTEKGLGSLKNLQDLNLEYNTLNCACNLEWLIKWVSENQTQVVFHNLANYFCAYPRSDRRITILNYDLEAEKCHSQLRYYAAILSSVFILVYMMAIFVMYRNRYYIEYGWYLLRSKAKGRPKAPLGKRKIYHAFISYNGRDSKWVTRRLVPKLEQEEPRLKLCIHERDFT
ncbi:PREDICTED: toll-like receptor 13, partial [Branchiostoma belcheri]|uniref:Toll-like receptor 13 n=1 Tax=Branchiostoma belcheri TaxID=7741 RepID=A0A6P4Y644_BRABE